MSTRWVCCCYELLTGIRPYRLGNAASIGLLQQAIRTVEAVKPSEQREPHGESATQFARELRGDLDAIILKALAKEPAERYAKCGRPGGGPSMPFAGKADRGAARSMDVPTE